MTETTFRLYSIQKLCLVLALCVFGAASAPGQKKEEQKALNRCWNISSLSPADQPLSSDGRSIFFVSDGGVINSVDASTGIATWKAELGGKVISNLLVRTTDLLAVTAPVGETPQTAAAILRSLSKETGIVNWSSKLSPAERFYLGAANDNIVVVGDTGMIYLVPKDGGAAFWHSKVTDQVASSPLIDDRRILVPTISGKTFTVSVIDGNVRANHSAKYPSSSLAVIAERSLVIGDTRGNLTSYNLETAQKSWRFKAGARWYSVVEADKKILAISADNFVYMLAPRRGNVIWKRRLSGRIAGEPAILDNLMVVAGSGESSAYVLDLANGRFVNEITLPDGDVFLSAPVKVSPRTVAMATRAGISLWSFDSCDELKKAAHVRRFL